MRNVFTDDAQLRWYSGASRVYQRYGNRENFPLTQQLHDQRGDTGDAASLGFEQRANPYD